MKYTIPKYTEDRSSDVGKKNLHNLVCGKGQLNFTGAYIFLAPICNFRCKGCFTHVYKNNSAQLSFNSIKKIVDFAKNRGAKSIIFAGAGEPTLDPLYKKIRNYINKLGLQVVLFTNGTTIKNKQEAKKMLLSGPVVAKMFSLNAKKYNELTGRKNAFALSMKGINFLIQARNELEKEDKKISLAIDSYISKENYKELPSLLKFCRKNRIIPYFESFIELGQPKNIIKQMALCEKKLANLFLELAKIDKEEFKINSKSSI